MAKSVKALITPEVLKWARKEYIELKIDFAAKKLKVDPKRLEAWENGTEQPTIPQLKKIARIYKIHISIFYLPVPPASFKRPTDYRLLPKRLATDEEQTYRLNANIAEAFERRETLIELYELLEKSLPQVSLTVDRGKGPRQAAEKITEFLEFSRERLQEAHNSHAALKFWKHAIESKGILVCQTNPRLSVKLETVRGFCIAQRPFPVIVINSKDSHYGRIFTLIHELVHIALGESIIQNTGFREIEHRSLNPVERFCNRVAGEILVPKNDLLEMIASQNFDEELSKISKHFHVSGEVIMRRLLILRKISPRKYQAYRKDLQRKYKSDSTKSGGGPPYHNLLLNVSGEHFARTAFTAYYEDKITISELVSAFPNCRTKHLSKIESAIFA